MSTLYIGLMSGTSADGIDAVLVDFQGEKCQLIKHSYLPYDPEIRNNILSLMQPGRDEIARMGALDRQVGHLFANAVTRLLKETDIEKEAVTAIGSHGQTIRHSPHS